MSRSTGFLAAALALSSVALAAVGVGTAKTLDPDTQRPALKDAAHWLDAHAQPTEPVIDVAYHPSSSPLGRRLQPYLHRPHPLYQAGDHDAAAFHGRTVFLVADRAGLFTSIPRQYGPHNRFRLVSESPTWPGQSRVVVLVYRDVP